MKIFLSSTAYDLFDFRALIVDILSKRGHEVLYHESPTFPAKYNLHTHDQCIKAVEECDIILAILDRRYGGKYNGQFNDLFNDQNIDISGFTKNGKKIKSNIIVSKSNLSITWCELITAYNKNIPVFTFARQRLLDEKETRRRNQHLKSFRPAFADKNELFDLIDWITKQKINNWITSFIDIVDFQKKMLILFDEIEKTITISGETEIEQNDYSKICIVVEGETDRIFVNYIIRKLKLKNYFVVIPSYGKYRILNNFKDTISQYASVFDQVIVLIDSDSKEQSEIEYMVSEFNKKIEQSQKKNISFHLTIPEIETWVAAGLNKDLYLQYNGIIDKDLFETLYEKFNTSYLSNVLRKKYDFQQAMQINREFHMFVEKLMYVGKR